MAEAANTPGERRQLGDVAAAYVRDQIISGGWGPGTRVKPELIATHLGISSTPVREALQALRSEGLVVLAPRRGFTVADAASKLAGKAVPGDSGESTAERTRPEDVRIGDEVASYIRNQITSGTWTHGTRVKPELIASDLGISATPVREALHALRSEGFLELAPRRGFAVARITGDDIRDMFVAQSFIAGELAARAADRITPEGIKRIENVHQRLTSAANEGDIEALGYWNQQFHKEVDLASESPRLAWVLTLVSRYSPQSFYADIKGWSQTTIDDHAGLLEAIRRHDAQAARSEMFDHVHRSGEQLARHIDERLAAAENDAQRQAEDTAGTSGEARSLSSPQTL
ncbi:GntR family transcriptional regulator [Rhodococcus wratislaviensis]|uniref:GntR family transcriptional regulator n=1 Tax=Rhodococcus wratislaviensis TaxID=44752 RepID=UPI00138E3EF9|nr:GntR family transcriptional regulator [Rhodococcus wratislaviensis]